MCIRDRSRVDIISYPPKFIFTPVMDNYKRVLQMPTLMHGLRNSLIIVPISLLLGFIFGVPVGYIFARIKFKRSADLRFFILSLRFMPPVAVALPFFLIWMRLRLLDSMPAVIFTYLTIAISTMTVSYTHLLLRKPLRYICFLYQKVFGVVW